MDAIHPCSKQIKSITAEVGLGAFVADDDDDITELHSIIKHGLHGFFFGFEDHGGSGMGEDLFVDAGFFHFGAIRGEVAE